LAFKTSSGSPGRPKSLTRAVGHQPENERYGEELRIAWMARILRGRAGLSGVGSSGSSGVLAVPDYPAVSSVPIPRPLVPHPAIRLSIHAEG
jgi:hypothetical protein